MVIWSFSLEKSTPKARFKAIDNVRMAYVKLPMEGLCVRVLFGRFLTRMVKLPRTIDEIRKVFDDVRMENVRVLAPIHPVRTAFDRIRKGFEMIQT